jgi:hypothetical protein
MKMEDTEEGIYKLKTGWQLFGWEEFKLVSVN